MNVPKLRFSKYNEEWNKIDLANIFSYFSTNSLSREQLSFKGDIKNLHYGDIHKKFGALVDVSNDINTFIKDQNFNNKYELCKENDLVIADASEDYEGIGKATEVINIRDNKIISGLHTIMARDNKSVFSPKFKGYYFNSPAIHNQIRVLANGFKVFGISKDTINSLNAYIPSKEEQKNIADMLQLLDKKIELQSQKIEVLKLYKMCIINNLFKEAKDIIRLKDICDCKPSTLSIDQLEFDVGEYKLYGANGMIKSINNYLFEHEYLGIIKDGASVGKTMICDKKSSILGTLNALFPINVDINYLNILINRINFQKYIVGSGIPHIYFKDYRNESLIVHSKNLQEKIGLLAKEYNKKILYEIDKLNMVNLLKKDLCKTCLYRAFLYIKKD